MQRVLFVSHEATLTGAPKIILNILKHFQAKTDVTCETILLSGGHLAASFTEYSTVDCFNLPSQPSEELSLRIKQAVFRERGNLPVLAICNSMESRAVAVELARYGIPAIFLIHELPSSYSESDYRAVFDTAQKIIFPCHTVHEQTSALTPMPHGKTLVLPQGLLDSGFGTRLNRDRAREQIRNELGVPENAAIVLGCGTIDLRKGCDHFAAIARQVSTTTSQSKPIHFVWLGQGPRWAHSLFHYLQIDLETAGVQNRVHFIGEQSDVEPWFMGADAFLLTSRVDPFPCVIHESMAASLPIVAFDGSGGVKEAISDGAGYLIPYGDYQQAASLIQMLVSQPTVAQGVTACALERVHTRYRFEDYGDRILELGESIIGTSLRKERSVLPFRKAA